MTYRIAIGFNNVSALADLNPQPACEGIRYAEIDFLPDGTARPNGYAFAELLYTALTSTEYNNLLTQMGLTTSHSSQVTIRLPNPNRSAFANYNAIIVKPNQYQYEAFFRNVVFLVRRIVAI